MPKNTCQHCDGVSQDALPPPPPPPGAFALVLLALAGALAGTDAGLGTLGTTNAFAGAALPGTGGGGIDVFAPVRAGAGAENFEGGTPLRFMMNRRERAQEGPCTETDRLKAGIHRLERSARFF
eukprot:s1804_g3.t1